MRTAASSAPARRPRSASLAAVRAGAMLAGCASLLCGCAIYHSKPLPSASDLARSPVLTVSAASLGVPGLKPEPLDPANGLNEMNVVTLAVVGNPRLKAARLQAGVAQAQLFAAGLLPDPQLSGGMEKSSYLTGYTAAIAEEIQALVTRGAAVAAARAYRKQVNLEILWQEWQVAQQARTLYIAARANARLQSVLDRRRKLLWRLYLRDEAAVQRRFVTVGTATVDYDAWSSAEAEWRAFELKENATRHALDELLGLAPGVRLRLRGKPAPQLVDASQYRSALAALPHRRPDLLALRAGYRSAEERLREAILAQFPLISAGVYKTQDAEEGIPIIGFNVNLALPLFNRNRGPIAIGRASRAYLHQAYQARLDETVSQVDEIRGAAAIMRRELAHLESRRTARREAAAAARRDLHRGTFSLSDYARVQSGVLSIEAQVIELGASLEQTQAALATLLALPF